MQIIRKFKRDKSGNIAMMFALLLSVLLLGVGAAVDMSQLASTKSKTSDIADGMALAAAIAAKSGKTVGERKRLGQEAADAVFEANKIMVSGVEMQKPDITIDDATKNVTIIVKAEVSNSLMSMFGHKTSTASSSAVVSYKIDAIPPISMAFAFDTSGSMGFSAVGASSKTRMEVLQGATQLLFDAMESEAENPTLLKASFSTTFSSYNTDIVASEDWSFGEQSITDVINYVDAMVPTGGTNSTPSLQYAYDQLVINRPTTDPKWRGFVLFMTDGANNNTAVDNPATLALCQSLRDDPSITVIAVAFSAPAAGEELLEECASDGKYYESKNASDIEKDFAKIGREIGETVFRLKS